MHDGHASAALGSRVDERPMITETTQWPGVVRQADAPFFHLAPARPASSDALRERLSASFGDRAQLAMRAVGRGPESDFSGRCDRDCGANALHLARLRPTRNLEEPTNKE